MIKKSLGLAALLLAVALCAAGCAGDEGSEISAASIWAEMEAEVGADAFPVLMEVDAAALETYYGLTDREAADYAGRIPLLNVTATEILIVRAKKGREEDVAAAMAARQSALEAAWSTYLPDQYALVLDSRTVVRGSWTLYVVAENADDIEAVFRQYPLS